MRVHRVAWAGAGTPKNSSENVSPTSGALGPRNPDAGMPAAKTRPSVVNARKPWAPAATEAKPDGRSGPVASVVRNSANGAMSLVAGAAARSHRSLPPWSTPNPNGPRNSGATTSSQRSVPRSVALVWADPRGVESATSGSPQAYNRRSWSKAKNRAPVRKRLHRVTPSGYPSFFAVTVISRVPSPYWPSELAPQAQSCPESLTNDVAAPKRSCTAWTVISPQDLAWDAATAAAITHRRPARTTPPSRLATADVRRTKRVPMWVVFVMTFSVLSSRDPD